MSEELPIACFVVLSEDHSEHAPQTITTFLKKLLGAITPYDASKLEFDPADAAIREGAAGNAWRCSDECSNPKVVRLLRFIATRIAREDYVFFHVDGDTPWSSRSASQTVADFEEKIVSRVEKLLGTTGDSARIAEMLKRIVRCTPHYSIEAWCYQNTSLAVDLARKHYGDAAADCFRQWAEDRGALDELHKPKEQCYLRSAHNQDLAGAGYPVQEVINVHKSFADTFHRLADAPGLLAIMDRCARN